MLTDDMVSYCVAMTNCLENIHLTKTKKNYIYYIYILYI